jgi:hypothetical protein
MAKYKAPDNFGGFTADDGTTYTADKKGFVTLPDGFDADVAAAHGLIPADGTPAAVADTGA